MAVSILGQQDILGFIQVLYNLISFLFQNVSGSPGGAQYDSKCTEYLMNREIPRPMWIPLG